MKPSGTPFLLALGKVLPVYCALVLLAGCEKKTPSPSATPSRSARPNIAAAEALQQRYAWNLKTLVEPYQTAGFANPTWDEAAKRALTAFASLRSRLAPETPWSQIIATNCEFAVQAGCKDPMIEYLHIRYFRGPTSTPKACADALCQAALHMKPSAYPVIRKFYANRRAVQEFYKAYDKKADRTIINQVGGTAYFLPAILADATIPIEEAYDACDETLQAYAAIKKLSEYEDIYRSMEQPMFDQWPNDYRPWLLKGSAHIKMAWICRGGGYADTVTKEGWKGFEDHLREAEKALARAWEINQQDINVPLKMMTVELGQGQGRERHDLWFKRAMAIDTNSYATCSDKLYYLEPKWHGSEADLLAFGRHCVESKEWGGSVPLILLDAHEKIQGYLDGDAKTNYWKQPDVWLDVQDAFDRFFELNPNATSWYYKYVWYANQCQRWDKLIELLPMLGQVDYAYFGGKPAFDKMVALAKQHAGETPPIKLTPAIELKRLTVKVSAKINEGKQTENDLADELKQFDALIAKYKTESQDDAAQALYLKATLYLQAINNPEKGKELIRQIKQDFPETKEGRRADQMLAAIDQAAQKKKIQEALALGTMFPAFQEKDLAGQTLSLASYKGKVVLVDFWATWCGPCVAELPNVQKTYQKYHDQGFEVIGVSLDENRSKVLNFTQQRNMPWPQYFDGAGWENKLASQYGIESIPATFLLDRQGNIIAKDLRGEALSEAVAKALAKK
jgi:thiol-disulfide isomerase/thioredoxin